MERNNVHWLPWEPVKNGRGKKEYHGVVSTATRRVEWMDGSRLCQECANPGYRFRAAT